MSFDPSEHFIELKLGGKPSNYLPVQWRLVWFREICPNGTIDTEEIVVDLDREVQAETFVWNAEKRRSEKVIKSAKGYARFRTVVTDGNGGRATGTKSEDAAHFPDYAEKAETGSIGRALAALGYGTQFVGNEMDEGLARIVDSPVPLPPLPPSPNFEQVAEALDYQDHLIAAIPEEKKKSLKVWMRSNLTEEQQRDKETLSVLNEAVLPKLIAFLQRESIPIPS